MISTQHFRLRRRLPPDAYLNHKISEQASCENRVLFLCIKLRAYRQEGAQNDINGLRAGWGPAAFVQEKRQKKGGCIL